MRRRPLDEGKRWLEQAREDLRWAEDLAHRGGYHIACFLAQQVGEKALKGFLYVSGDEIVLGHSVERLCAEAAVRQPEFRESARRWSVLDGFYVATGTRIACPTASRRVSTRRTPRRRRFGSPARSCSTSASSSGTRKGRVSRPGPTSSA